MHGDDMDELLRSFAQEVGSVDPVAVAGGRTRWSSGGELAPGTREVRAPEGIVDYVPEEMVVRVRAGTAVSDLHDALREKGQWSALPERGGTVGGALAVGENDFRRRARGDVRSATLQVRYVSAEGAIVSGGGPTVKNVSGFDLPRLLTGSLGTLGCIGEVILRTNPIPPRIEWLRSHDADPFTIDRDLLDPGAILWDGTTTTVMLHGHGPAVDADIGRLASYGTFSVCDSPEAPTGHRWSVTPALLRDVDSFDTGSFVAEVGVGVIHAQRPQPSEPLTPGVSAVHDRMKAEFDPTGRLNPGRVVGARP